MTDYGYSSHRRVVTHLSGRTVKKNLPFVHAGPITILENRVNGMLRSVTVLDSANGRAITRLDGDTARY